MKSKTTLLMALTVLTVILLTACNAPKGQGALENKTWVLESYSQQDSLQDVLEGTEITAIFDSAEGEISGSAGCNSYFASYDVDGSKLSISTIGCTEMFCVTPEGVMEQEEQYLTTLATAESYEVRDGQLHIFCSGGQVLIFSAR
jgi:heat shock protein HslJ